MYFKTYILGFVTRVFTHHGIAAEASETIWYITSSSSEDTTFSFMIIHKHIGLEEEEHVALIS